MLSNRSQRSAFEIVDATNAAPVGGSRHLDGESRRSNTAKDAAVAALVAAEVVTLSARVAETDAPQVAVLIATEVAASVAVEIVTLMPPRMS